MSKTLANSLARSVGGEVIETHISWLVLRDDDVFKIKKPVDLGFLDFSTLEARKYFCEEEIRLNRRTAPHIYRDIIAIGGSPEDPVLGAEDGAAIEYAVHMNRFDDSRLLDGLAEAGAIDADTIDALADAIAAFHAGITDVTPVADADRARHGAAYAVRAPVMDNFTSLEELDHDPADARVLRSLRAWVEPEFERLAGTFDRRYADGFVRECHGDLHLGNIFMEDGRAVLFDCIEFNPDLRHIDVASDIAFTVMDLANVGLPEYSRRLLNEYLARTGDYGSVQVMDWYLVYRAMVRAKVAAIRARQHDGADAHHECRHYLELAQDFTRPRQPAVILMCGLSGTGKTTVARELAATLDAIHVRSDVERKRLFGLDLTASSHDTGKDIYTAQATAQTFERLASLARETERWRRPVIVDATFIERHLRAKFADVADELGVPWAIVECTASEDTVRQRLAGRTGDASEAGIAQYQDQRARFESFDEHEAPRVVEFDTEADDDTLAERVTACLRNGRRV